MVLESILPLALLFMVKYMIDLVETIINSPDTVNMAQVWVFLVVLCGIYILNELSGVLDNFINEILGQKMVDRVSKMLQQKSVELDRKSVV